MAGCAGTLLEFGGAEKTDGRRYRESSIIGTLGFEKLTTGTVTL